MNIVITGATGMVGHDNCVRFGAPKRVLEAKDIKDHAARTAA